MNLAPIVLFTYRRLWHTRQTVEALQENELARESELFIYSDGWKNDHDKPKVLEVREYLITIDGFKEVHIIERERNYGLADNIIDGVTRIVNRFGRIIVLEDDIVTSRYFLRFMNEALERYQNTERVFGVTGYAFPINKEKLPKCFFLKLCSSWSWGTWARKWKFFKKDTDNLLKIFTKEMIRDFNFDNSMDFWSQVIANKKGKINSWAIYWYAAVFLNEGLFLYPRDAFAKNIGHDNSGVHCGTTSVYDVELVNEYNMVFPSKVEVPPLVRQRHVEYFNSLKVPFLKKVRNKIKQLWTVKK